MSYQEKRTIVTTITGILLLAAYCIYAYMKQKSGVIGEGDIRYWAVTMLVFIGVGIVVNIIIQILFHILMSISIAVQKAAHQEQCDDKEIEKIINSEMIEDEMDRLISLKSMKISFLVVGFGFMAGLVSLVLNYSPVVMLHIIFITFSGGSLLEGFSQLYYYKMGVHHG